MTTIYKHFSLHPHTNIVFTLIKETHLCNRWISLHKTTTNQRPELQSPFPMDTSTKYWSSKGIGNTAKKRAEDQGLCGEAVSSSSVRSYILKMSPDWQPKCKQNKDDSNGDTKVDKKESKIPQQYTKNYRHQRNAASERGDLPQNWVCHL